MSVWLCVCFTCNNKDTQPIPVHREGSLCVCVCVCTSSLKSSGSVHCSASHANASHVNDKSSHANASHVNDKSTYADASHAQHSLAQTSNDIFITPKLEPLYEHTCLWCRGSARWNERVNGYIMWLLYLQTHRVVSTTRCVV